MISSVDEALAELNSPNSKNWRNLAIDESILIDLLERDSEVAFKVACINNISEEVMLRILENDRSSAALRIAMRRKLSNRVIDKIMQIGDENIIAALIENMNIKSDYMLQKFIGGGHSAWIRSKLNARIILDNKS